MSRTVQLESGSAERTREIGAALGALLRVGDVVALVGPLGAGKTMLVKGVAAGAGVGDTRRVTSPTFVLVNEYDGRTRLFHVDAYRLGGEREFEALGADEFAGQGAVLIEWADRVAGSLPLDSLRIEIDVAGADSRILRCTAAGGRGGELLAALAAL